MAAPHDVTTDPILLVRLADWDDFDAWWDFVRRYEPLILGWCRAWGLGGDPAHDVAQRVFVRLAGLMRGSRYDCTRSFRKWLFPIVRNTAHAYRRELGRLPQTPLPADAALDLPDEFDDEDHPLLQKAREVQLAVQSSVNPSAWRVFWLTDIEGEDLGDVASAAGMRYHAAFMARKRVRQRLESEGRRILLGRSEAELE